MPSLRSRREILQLGIPVVALSLAGCTSLDPTGCDDMHEAVIEAEPVTLSSEQRSSVDPLVFEELPPEEQELVRISIDEEAYRKCPAADPDVPDPLSSFAGRAVRHADENYTTYLKRGDEYYRLHVRIGDQVYAS